mmetsp:Transcript_14695/g.32292  ORF Transcript_14695/g.32292 Transcript_14695/m.32292 type:complete len:268 (+) Transcript_14695:1723-2526(+)
MPALLILKMPFRSMAQTISTSSFFSLGKFKVQDPRTSSRACDPSSEMDTADSSNKPEHRMATSASTFGPDCASKTRRRRRDPTSWTPSASMSTDSSHSSQTAAFPHSCTGICSRRTWGESIAACHAQPRATASSALRVVLSSLPSKASLRARWIQGTRETPPTTSTLSRSLTSSLAAVIARATTSLTFWCNGAQMSSNTCRFTSQVRSKSSTTHSAVARASSTTDSVFFTFIAASSSFSLALAEDKGSAAPTLRNDSANILINSRSM